jgi:hypothetical protein
MKQHCHVMLLSCRKFSAFVFFESILQAISTESCKMRRDQLIFRNFRELLIRIYVNQIYVCKLDGGGIKLWFCLL